MKFTTDIENSKLIESFFQQESTINLAIAFIGESAWKYFKDSQDDIFILCNLESGATNPSIIEKLCSRTNIKIKTNKKLHAKVYIGKDQLIVSSANLSANGLSYEDNEIKGWIEASLTSRDKKVIQDANNWFQLIWGSSSNITQENIKTAKVAWKKKRNSRLVNSGESDSILDALLNNELKDKEVYLAIYRNYSGQEAQEKWDDVQDDYGKKFDYYEDWDDIPSNAFCIDLYYGIRGKAEIQDIYKTPEYPIIEKFKYKNGQVANLNIVHKVSKVLDKYSFSKKDKKTIENVADKIWDKFNNGNVDATLVKLHDIKEILT